MGEEASKSTGARRLALVATSVVSLVAAGCGGGNSSNDYVVPSECRDVGKPVSLGVLIDVFRESGIALFADTDCAQPGVSGSDAKTALDAPESEPTVFCSVNISLRSPDVKVYKADTDVETGVSALNAVCTVYPTSPDAERSEIERVRRGLEKVVSRMSHK